jgi:hypothetical protein
MKEPRNALERHAADIDDAATTANLRVLTLFDETNPPTHSESPDGGDSFLGFGCG